MCLGSQYATLWHHLCCNNQIPYVNYFLEYMRYTCTLCTRGMRHNVSNKARLHSVSMVLLWMPTFKFPVSASLSLHSQVPVRLSQKLAALIVMMYCNRQPFTRECLLP